MNTIQSLIDSNTTVRDYEYTKMAARSLRTVISSRDFEDQSPEVILNFLLENKEQVSFGDQLRRYLFGHFDMGPSFSSIGLKDYIQLIITSFKKNGTPFSMEASTRAPSASVKKWLTQTSVRRSVVFLLGFGLRMSIEDVETFLVKYLNERSFNLVDFKEAIYQYCYFNGFDYAKAQSLIDYYNSMDPSDPRTPVLTGSPKLGKMRSDEEIKAYLCHLKTKVKYEKKKDAAYTNFDLLLDTVIALIAEDKTRSHFDHDNSDLSSGFTRDMSSSDISLRMVEETLYSSTDYSEDGNIQSMKDSLLKDKFARYRLSRQRMNGLRKQTLDVDRYDLITLLFFIYSQENWEFRSPQMRKKRCMEFIDQINEILVQSGMIRMYPVNPYESFILLCLMSRDPWDTFCDVWYESYHRK